MLFKLLDLADIFDVSFTTIYHYKNTGKLPFETHIKGYQAFDDKNIKAFNRLFKIKPVFNKKTIAFMIQKGGVGKTTLSNAFAIRASLSGAKVLLIDMDPQAHQTKLLHMQEWEKSIYHILLKKVPAEEVIISTRYSNLDLLPADELDMPSFEIEAAHLLKREYQVRKLCKSLHEKYDLIVIDTPPNFGLTHQMVTLASDMIIAPIQPTRLEIESVDRFIGRIYAIQKEYAEILSGQKLYTFPNIYNGSHSNDAIVMTLLLEHFKNEYLKDSIDYLTFRQTQDFKTAREKKESIWDSKKYKKAREDMKRLYNAIIGG